MFVGWLKWFWKVWESPPPNATIHTHKRKSKIKITESQVVVFSYDEGWTSEVEQLSPPLHLKTICNMPILNWMGKGTSYSVSLPPCSGFLSLAKQEKHILVLTNLKLISCFHLQGCLFSVKKLSSYYLHWSSHHVSIDRYFSFRRIRILISHVIRAEAFPVSPCFQLLKCYVNAGPAFTHISLSIGFPAAVCS